MISSTLKQLKDETKVGKTLGGFKRQHSSSFFLFSGVSRVYLSVQVGRLYPQTAPSLSRVAAVAPGQRPLDTTTVSLNNVFLRWSLPPPLHLCLLPAHLRLPPIMETRIDSRLLCLYRYLLSESCLLLPNCGWCELNQTVVIVFVCPPPRLCPLSLRLIVRPALLSVRQHRKRAEWSESKQASYLYSVGTEVCL